MHSFWVVLERLCGLRVDRVYAAAIAQPIDLGPLPEGLQIRVLNREDCHASWCASNHQLSRKFLVDALARGDVGAAVFEGEQVVAFVWRTFSEAPFRGDVWVKVASPAVYGYKAYTDPRYRGMRLSSHLTATLNRICLERGAQNRIAAIVPHNRSSIQAELHRGSRYLGLAVYWQFAGIRRKWLSSAVKAAGYDYFWKSGS